MKNKCELCEEEAMNKNERFCWDCALKFNKGFGEGYDSGYTQCLADNTLDKNKNSVYLEKLSKQTGGNK